MPTTIQRARPSSTPDQLSELIEPTFDRPTHPHNAASVEEVARPWADIELLYWPWPNFRPEEMACNGSGLVYVTPKLMDFLEALRRRLDDRPLSILSGYRSPAYNRLIPGAAKASHHMLGEAADISCQNIHPEDLIEAAKDLGVGGIGEYPEDGFIHLDVRQRPRNGKIAYWHDGGVWDERTSRFALETNRGARSKKTASTITAGTLTAGSAGVASMATIHADDVLTYDQILRLVPYGVGTLALVAGLYYALRRWNKIVALFRPGARL